MWITGRGLSKVLMLILISYSLACFKNPGDEASPTLKGSVPIYPVYTNSASSYLQVSGPCYGNTAITFQWTSNLTVGGPMEVLCIKDQVNTKLPVSQGDKNQIFTVTMFARLKSKKTKPISVQVSFTPPPPPSPGFAVLSGGDYTTGAGVRLNASIGEPFSPQLQTGAGVTSRTGVQAIFDP